MKKKILASFLLSLTFCGTVWASPLNGLVDGHPIVKVRVNGAEVTSTSPAMVYNDTTLLPLRAISESLGANVEWHQDNYSVDVTMPKSLSLTELNKIGENVGIVYAIDAAGNYVSQGSGFLLSGGIFVTCDHVVTKAAKLRIDLNGKTYNTTSYLFRNGTTDLAAVKIDAVGGLKIAATQPAANSKVYSLGFPHGKFQINEGKYYYTDNEGLIHDARTDGGSSGGLLINNEGAVLGVTSAGYDEVEVNAAIPFNKIQDELNKLH